MAKLKIVELLSVADDSRLRAQTHQISLGRQKLSLLPASMTLRVRYRFAVCQFAEFGCQLAVFFPKRQLC